MPSLSICDKGAARSWVERVVVLFCVWATSVPSALYVLVVLPTLRTQPKVCEMY